MSTRRYLIVDDNRDFAANLGEILEAAGAEAVVLDDGAHALAALESTTPFDALVSDMRMPRMNGAELLARAHAVDPQLPLVLLTAFARDAELARVTDLGVATVLHKPVAVQELMSVLASLRRGPRS